MSMIEVKERPRMVERALLVGVYREHREAEEAGHLIEELADLVRTLDIGIVGQELVKVGQFNAKLLMGSGRAHDITMLAKELQADVIVFDHELSPAQQRNWEELTGVTVIDRHEVILDIFGRRAVTKEAQLQVKLARLVDQSS